MTPLTEAVNNLPRYSKDWSEGLATVALSDVNASTFLVTGLSVAAGTRSPAKGLAAFLGLYSLARIADRHDAARILSARIQAGQVQ